MNSEAAQQTLDEPGIKGLDQIIDRARMQGPHGRIYARFACH